MWQTLTDAVAMARPVWVAGGWAMLPLAFNGVVIFALGASIMLRLWSKGVQASSERAWQAWLKAPTEVRGPIGRLIAEAMGTRSLEALEHYFAAVQNEELTPFERDLQAMKVCVGTAPLLGLLGTVTGMLTTFKALATGSGGDQTMTMIASGISEALITTETGLVIALTGLVFQFLLVRQRDAYMKLLAHVETLCMQHYPQKRQSMSAA
jgi:biopolymer transport protein ExbB